MISLDQKDARKRRFLPGMIKRLGCGQFSLGKLLRECGHCQGETLPMETGKKESGD